MDHIADMWKSADEDVRGAVRETVLSFGRNVKRFSFIGFFYSIFFLPTFHLQVKRDNWPFKGWNSCALIWRRRHIKTKRQS